MINVIIADDQTLLRESLSFILGNDDEINVVGLAENGEEVVELCKTLKPDIILMDIEMPKRNGVNATKILKEEYPEVKIIMLTTFENADNIMESFVVGADGYIVKNIKHNDLVLTVKCVASGLFVIHQSVKDIMIDRFKGLSQYKSKYQDKISEKEIEIIKLIATGKSNKEIAAAMNYSEGTIKNNVSKILEKLALTDRMQVAIFAIENKIV